MRTIFQADNLVKTTGLCLIFFCLCLLTWVELDVVRSLLERLLSFIVRGSFTVQNTSFADVVFERVQLLEQHLPLTKYFGSAQVTLTHALPFGAALGCLALFGLIRLGLAKVAPSSFQVARTSSFFSLGQKSRQELLFERETAYETVQPSAFSLADAAARVSTVTLYASTVSLALGGTVLLGSALLAALFYMRSLLYERAQATYVHVKAVTENEYAQLEKRLSLVRAHGTYAREQAALTLRLLDIQAAVSTGLKRLDSAETLLRMLEIFVPVLFLGAASLLGSGSLSGGIAVLLQAGGLSRSMERLTTASSKGWKIARSNRTGNPAAATHRLEATVADASQTFFMENLTALDPRHGTHIGPITLTVPLPSHIALMGGTEVQTLSTLAGGLLEPLTGDLRIGTLRPGRLPAQERARAIAFAGIDPVLIPGTWRDNLSYGMPENDACTYDETLRSILETVGLTDAIRSYGLRQPVDGKSNPTLAATLVSARTSLRQSLTDRGLDTIVAPFMSNVFNRYASLGDNILFGAVQGDGPSTIDFASHPFMLAVLEAEGLTRTCTEMGLEIARSTTEIFAGIPNDHPLFERFSFYPASERGVYESIVARSRLHRHDASTGEDRKRLIALSLRYIEPRHRLGLLDPKLESRALSARATFRALLPAGLRDHVSFYDPEGLCAAASFEDNILFGRIAEDIADAEPRVRAILAEVIQNHGLQDAVLKTGLTARLSAEISGSSRVRYAVDLARCLLRRTHVLVVEGVCPEVGQDEVQNLLIRLRRAQAGRTLIIALPKDTPTEGFDRTISIV